MGTEVVSTLALSGLQRTGWPSAAGRVVGIGGAAVLRVHGEDKGVWGSTPLPQGQAGWCPARTRAGWGR